jgi:hypothetical protein
MMPDSLPLSDLLARPLNLEWYEGVAIVRSVAQRLSEHRGLPVSIPELHQIQIAAEGTVAVVGGVPATEPVRRLGQLLQAILSDAEVPVQLRLIVSQATAPIPTYSSFGEFDQALAYFERPDRTGLLAALFARAEAAGPVTASHIALTLDRIAPLPDAKSAEPHRKTSRVPIGVAVAVIAVLALSVTAALYLRTAGTTARGRGLSRASAMAADAVGAAVLAGVSAVSNSVGLGRLVAADAADPPSASAAVLRSAPGRRTKSGRRAAGEPVMSRLERLPSHRIVVYDPPDSPESMNEIPAGAEIVYLSHVAPIDLEVYAPGANGVSPPFAVRAQLPQQLPPTVDPANLSRIELVIGRNGTVESARLLGTRRDVQGGMFLSAVKAWEFQPAMKDGIAVRYRKTVLVSFE